MTDATFGDLYPALAPLATWSLAGDEMAPMRDTHDARLEVEWFVRHGVTTIGDLLALPIDAPFSWTGFGSTKVARLAAFVERLDASATSLLVALVPTDDEATPPPSSELHLEGIEYDLSALLDWAHFSSGATTLEEALTVLSRGHAPADVAEVVKATLAVPVPPVHLDPLADLRDWMFGLDARDAAILHRRLIRFEGATLDELGFEFGVTRERIRQVETKLKTRLDEWITSPQGRSVRWALHLLSVGLGASAPDSAVPLVGDDGGTSDEFGLLLYLADMVWEREAQQIRRRGFRWPSIREVPAVDEGPLVNEPALADLLVERGVVDEHLAWAVDHVEGLRRLSGKLVFWPGNLVEQAMAVLTVEGRPMPDDDIADAFDRDFNRRGLRDRMLQDPRIIRVTKDDFALTSWGMPEYGGIVSSMVQRLEDVGPTPVRDLADFLAERHNIKPGSVLAYSAAPIFVTEGGRLRLRRADEPYMPALAPSTVRGLYRVSETRIAWHIPVDKDVLRGSGRFCPAEIATAIGVFPGRSETLTNDVRELKVLWAATSHMGPSISSLRAHADAAGTVEGDVLRVVFDRGTHAVAISKFTGGSASDPRSFLAAVLDVGPELVSRHRVAQAVFAEDADLEAALDRRHGSTFERQARSFLATEAVELDA